MENKNNLLNEAMDTAAKAYHVSIIKEEGSDAKPEFDLSGDPVVLMAAFTEAIHKVLFDVADEKGAKNAMALGKATSTAIINLFPMAYLNHKLEARFKDEKESVDKLQACEDLLNDLFQEG